ncbi:alpha-amylase family glycosyl hydrolase [Roseateles terrae]|uniref:Glycosidase n=1 Tax=Roseateles terrae TaxID=431060 RepID=A0ABR6GQD9_9BURK|nr:alpha-amylase family glycosyl hydrolase [Roseateles terrae]MBB3194274.1 glycosidase [Roseateles terrae]OWQ88115.1 hypothetical protein CDN98_08235 [Roseateles terrae]
MSAARKRSTRIAVLIAAAASMAAPSLALPRDAAPAAPASASTSASAPAFTAPPPATDACTAPPLAGRDLYLRGTLNNWSAPDTQRLYWVCDHHELILQLKGEQSFKIGDEDWSADADFGGDPRAMTLKGAAIQQRFDGGLHRLELRWAQGTPSLTVAPCPPTPAACSAYPAPDPNASSVTDPVALSVLFDSRSTDFKRPFGALPAGSWVEFELKALPGVTRVELVVDKRRLEGPQERLDYTEQARAPMHKLPGALDAQGRERWSVRHRFGAPAVYGYYFVVTIGGQRYVYGNNKDSIYWTREKGSMGVGLIAEIPGGKAGARSDDHADDKRRIRRYRQTVHAADFTVPAWARDAVYYYVFPERFRNGDPSNDPKPGRDRYQGHDIEFHTNWMDRPYKPGSGDGSDAVYNNDFYGGDLAGLISKLDDIQALGANALYLTPIFKAASNHKYDTADYKRVDPAFGTNDDFKRLTAEAARRGIRVIPDTSLNHVGADSPYFNRFSNYPAGGAFDGGKINPTSPYAGWFSFDTTQTDPDRQFKGWMDVKDLPELNKASKDFRRFAYEASDSVTTFWLDQGAAGWRMDVAPYVPDDFWRGWRQAVKHHRPDALTIAETWFDASKFFLGDSFDGTMNYIFRNTVLDYAAGGRADRLYQNLELLREAYPAQALAASMNLLSTHDQPRALHHLGADEGASAEALALAKRRLLLAVWFQMTWPGAPTIYYGDEVGVTGGDDPYNRAPYPWADLGGHPDEALKAQVRQLVALRQQWPVLRHGSLEAPLLLDEHLIVLLRRDGAQAALVALNNADEAKTVALQLPPSLQGQALQDALGGDAVTVAPDGRVTLEVPALSGRVWMRSSR